MNTKTMWAIAKRDFLAYFGSLTGYVFVLAFILLTFLFAFRPWTGDFFVANKATLWLLNPWFPLVLALFAPAVTMGSWASEKQQGTDALLLTLPIQDWELIVAKFAACFGVYSVALAFTLVYVCVLEFFGDPDLGLMFATYLGYWLLGAAALAIGMFSSALTSNQTVAWILGVTFLVLTECPRFLAGSAEGTWLEPFAALSVLERYRSFGDGVISLQDLAYLVGLTAVALYANALVLGSRHWTIRRARMLHGILRLASLAVAGISLVFLGEAWGARLDVTSAQMLSLRPEARKVLAELQRPVRIQAWISPRVPQSYQATREALLSMLREFDARGGEMVKVTVHETELYTEEAKAAEVNFGIKPRQVEAVVGGRRSVEEIFLGLAFTSGSRQVVIPFFDKGLPVQYELTRAIGAVAQLERSKIAVMSSGVDLFGGFDFQTMNRREEWKLLEDLRKQYEVTKTEGTAPVGTAVLVVPLPSSLSQEKMDVVAKHLYDGGKAIFFCDPYPEFDLSLAPSMPANPRTNPFQPNRGPQKPPKGNVAALFDAMGVTWKKDRIVWDDYNPHPEWPDIPRELVFVAPAGEDRPSGFNEEDPITSGLQEVVLIFPGELSWSSEDQDVEVTPLLWTCGLAGTHDWRQMVQEGFFGLQPLPEQSRIYEGRVDVVVRELKTNADKAGIVGLTKTPPSWLGASGGWAASELSLDALPATVFYDVPLSRARLAASELVGMGALVDVRPHQRVLALKIKGRLKAPSDAQGMSKGKRSEKTFEAIVVADMDMVSNVFYSLREQGRADLTLDNVTFVANCIDALAGEHSYIELRKLRPKHRTLTYFEAITKEFELKESEAIKRARDEAEKKLAEAKQRFEAKVKKIEQRTDLDARTKAIQVEAVRRAEQRRLDLQEKRIKDAEAAKIRLEKTQTHAQIQRAQLHLLLGAFVASTVLPVLLGVVVLVRKILLERAGVDVARRRS
ncbi:MAG: hypothetical protein D6731_20995 [Planctomycetota bacterium]|nr:MAG: hypothetical protein D6731_20995 [Planctomycetota bacterium]